MKNMVSVLGLMVCFVVTTQKLYAQGAGYALQFDGVDDYVLLQNLAVDTSTGHRNTVEFWINWNGNDYEMPFGWNTEYDLFLYGGYFGFNTDQGEVLGFSSSGMVNTWVHVAAVFYNGVPSADSNKIYINGILQTLSHHQVSNSYQPLPRTVTSTAVIAYWGLNLYDCRFRGVLDEVRIWNRELTQAEIQQNMNRSLIGNEPGLVGYWPFNEGAGTTTHDASGHGNDGTLVNGPQWVASDAPIYGDTIPNSGFENWTLGIPDHWITNNVLPTYVPITKSTDAHGGSFALQGTVVNVGAGFGYPPSLLCGFPIGTRDSLLTGFYKFSPVGGDTLSIVMLTFKQGTGIGAGVFQTGTAQSSYTQFSAVVNYSAEGTPDSACIGILVSNPGNTHAGTTFKIDDLAFFSMVPSAQAHNVTFILNTCTVPDTLPVNGSTVQLRGQLMNSGTASLTWGSDSMNNMTHIGGDYWSKTITLHTNDTLLYKFVINYVGNTGWEADVTPPYSGMPVVTNNGVPVFNRCFIVGTSDTTLPLEFWNNGAFGRPQYFRPWNDHAADTMVVYFRVNMVGPMTSGSFGFDNNVDTVGVRGRDSKGLGELHWSPTFYLTKESPATDGAGYTVPAASFWSGAVRIPKDSVNAGDVINYKFLIGYNWGRDELRGQPNRSFVVPTGKKDTTLQWVFYNNGINQNTITASTSGHGTISPSDSVNVNYGGNQVFTISPDADYRIDSVVVDGIRSDSTTSYTFINVITTHAITAYFSLDLHTLLLNFRSRWNIVSVPVRVSDSTKTTLFPNAISNALAYQGNYVSKTALSNGVGYWLKFDSAQQVSIVGLLLKRDTMNVTEGWNLIGSLSTPIAVAQITSDPGAIVTSEAFGFEGRYVTSDSILPGKGYWVKVNRSGKLILTSSSSMISASNRIKILASEELPPAAPDENEPAKVIPKTYALEQNYPNPFNPTTMIHYQLSMDSRVTLKVYNTLGQVVATLVDGVQSASYQSAEWDASSIASGIYFYRLEATSTSDPTKSFAQVKKMILMR